MSPSGGTAGSHGSSILVDITPRTQGHRVPFSTSLLDHATLSFLDSRHSNLVFDFYFGFDFDPLDDPWFWISFCVSGGHSRMFVLSTWPFTNYFSIEVSEFLICSRYKHSTEYLLFGRLPLLLTMPFIIYSSWLHILYLTSSLRIPGQTPAMIFLPLLSHTPVSLPPPPLSSALLNAYKIWNGLLNTEQLGTWQPLGLVLARMHATSLATSLVQCFVSSSTRLDLGSPRRLISGRVWEGVSRELWLRRESLPLACPEGPDSVSLMNTPTLFPDSGRHVPSHLLLCLPCWGTLYSLIPWAKQTFFP